MKKCLPSLGGKFFPFKVDPFQKGKQTGSHKKMSSLLKMVEYLPAVSGPIKRNHKNCQQKKPFNLSIP